MNRVAYPIKFILKGHVIMGGKNLIPPRVVPRQLLFYIKNKKKRKIEN